MSLLQRKRERRGIDAVITSPEQHTTMDADGAVRSLQAADVEMPAADLDAIWSPMHLERLARTYWRYLSRVTLGLVRVHYSATGRDVVLLARPLVLLRFHPPEYEIGPARGIVRWRIRSGLLVARRDHGHLEIEVQRRAGSRPGQARAHVEVEVANFYPSLAHFIARWFYSGTQSRIHVLVTHGFLRSLARLELEKSPVGRFDDAGPDPVEGAPRSAGPAEDLLVGETPWGVVAVAAAAAAVLGLLVGAALRSRR